MKYFQFPLHKYSSATLHNISKALTPLFGTFSFTFFFACHCKLQSAINNRYTLDAVCVCGRLSVFVKEIPFLKNSEVHGHYLFKVFLAATRCIFVIKASERFSGGKVCVSMSGCVCHSFRLNCPDSEPL